MKKWLFLALWTISALLTWQSATAGSGINIGDTSTLIQDARIQHLADSYSQKLAKESGDLKVQADGTASIESTAPALTYLEVYAVTSSQYPSYEYISQNQLSTVNDHGGAEMYVVTVELGYGGSRIAQLNGGNLSEIQNQAITDSSGNIVGWYRWWDASGYQSGYFTYQSTSLNSPWNTMSDALSIQ